MLYTLTLENKIGITKTLKYHHSTLKKTIAPTENVNISWSKNEKK